MITFETSSKGKGNGAPNVQHSYSIKTILDIWTFSYQINITVLSRACQRSIAAPALEISCFTAFHCRTVSQGPNQGASKTMSCLQSASKQTSWKKTSRNSSRYHLSAQSCSNGYSALVIALKSARILKGTFILIPSGTTAAGCCHWCWGLSHHSWQLKPNLTQSKCWAI